MLSFLFGCIGSIVRWAFDIVSGALIESLIFG
jgi:hypothetical protein